MKYKSLTALLICAVLLLSGKEGNGLVGDFHRIPACAVDPGNLAVFDLVGEHGVVAYMRRTSIVRLFGTDQRTQPGLYGHPLRYGRPRRDP